MLLIKFLHSHIKTYPLSFIQNILFERVFDAYRCLKIYGHFLSSPNLRQKLEQPVYCHSPSVHDLDLQHYQKSYKIVLGIGDFSFTRGGH